MAVSLSANVWNRRKGRDNHTDREGPQTTPTEPFETIGTKVGNGAGRAVPAVEAVVSFESGRLRLMNGHVAFWVRLVWGFWCQLI